MKEFDVVFLKSSSESFSWNDGLFALYKIEYGNYYLWKIDKDGLPVCYEDKTPAITCINVQTADVNRTGLKLFI